MAFTSFTNSTTAYAEDVHSNFLHVGSESLLPMANTGTMGITSGTYDLGSNSYKWNTIFCDSIDGGIVDYGWLLLTEGYGDTAGSIIEVVENFEQYDEVMVIGYSTIFFNADSSSNYVGNYNYYQFDGSTNLVYEICITATSAYGGIKCVFKTKSTSNKSYITYGYSPTLLYCGKYSDNVTTLTSIKIDPASNGYYGVFVR